MSSKVHHQVVDIVTFLRIFSILKSIKKCGNRMTMFNSNDGNIIITLSQYAGGAVKRNAPSLSIYVTAIRGSIYNFKDLWLVVFIANELKMFTQGSHQI